MIAAADAARADERLPGGAAIEAPKIGEQRGRRVLPRTPCRPVATSPAQHRRHAGFGDLCPEAVGIRDHAGIDLAQRLTHRMVPPSGADCGARRAPGSACATRSSYRPVAAAPAETDRPPPPRPDRAAPRAPTSGAPPRPPDSPSRTAAQNNTKTE